MSEIIGAMLLFGVLIALLVLVQVMAVPAWNAQTEFQHNQRVQGDVLTLSTAIQDAANSNIAKAVTVELGVSYPVRPFLLNPPASSGALRTESAGEITVRHAAASGETGDYWTGARTVSYDTKRLKYTPNYNQYRAPDTVYEDGAVYNVGSSGNAAGLIGQTQLVSGTTVNLVALDGTLNENGVGSATVQATPVSPSTRTVSVSGANGKPVTVTFQTNHPEVWNDVLADQTQAKGGNVLPSSTYVAANSTYVLRLDGSKTYALRTAKVGVGTGATESQPSYLTWVAGGGGSYVPENTATTLTSEVRDSFNAPKSGVNVQYQVVAGSGTFVNDATPNDGSYTVKTDENGQAPVSFVPTTTNGPVSVEAHAEFNGQSGYQNEERVLYTMTTVAPTNGGGGGSSDDSGLNPSSKGKSVYLASTNWKNPDGNSVTLTFDNLANISKTITGARVNFYHASSGTTATTYDLVNQSAQNDPTIVKDAPVRGPFSPVSVHFGPYSKNGTSDTVKLAFKYSPNNVSPNDKDLFAVTFRFADGSTATYIVG